MTRFSTPFGLLSCTFLLILSACLQADIHPNLVHWWRFDEATGETAADAAGSADGTLAYGASRMAGALHLDGVDDHVILADMADDFSGGLTVSAWIYPKSVSIFWARFLEFGNGINADNIIFGFYYMSDDMVFQCYDGSLRGNSVVAENIISPNRWQLMTATLDANGNVQLYKSGFLIQTGVTYPANSVSRTQNYIGKSSWTNDAYFHGLMDDVRVYNTVLSAPEIQALAADVPPELPNPTELWVDDDYQPTAENDGHTWLLDAFDNIPDALGAADYGDTIHVNAGTYYVDRNGIELKNGVKIIGDNPSSTIIDATPNEWVMAYSVFTANLCDTNTAIENLTVRNAGKNADGFGSWDEIDGAAVYTYQSHLIIRNCIFENNIAGNGGAIYNDSRYIEKNIRIENCTFINNRTSTDTAGLGGAIWGLPPEGVISGCTFIDNAAYRGGALAFLEGTVENCIFTGNVANWNYDARGGAIYMLGRSEIQYNTMEELSHCQFINNTTNGQGGAIFGVYVPVSDCLFEGNSAASGGAVYTVRETVRNCTFNANAATVNGGAVDTGSIGHMIDCTFTANSAGWRGGGISIEYAPTTVDGCLFSENTAGYAGGGIYISDSDSIIRNNRFIANFAVGDHPGDGNGGGLYVTRYADAAVSHCLFMDNVSSSSGAAIAVNSRSNPFITNCLAAENDAGDNGGGFYADGSCDVTIALCTLVGNTAQQNGGGICFGVNDSLVTSSILWSNQAAVSGNEIFTDNSNGTYYSVVQYSDIQGSGGSGSGWDASLGIDGGGNMDADPLFADDPNDYHLKSQAGRYEPVSDQWVPDTVTSPCIDAGDPGLALGPEPFPNGGYVNMGAYGGTVEASMSWFGTPPCAAAVDGDINGDCRVDLADLSILAFYWLLDHRPAPCTVMAGDLNADCMINLQDFDRLDANWLIDLRSE